MAVNQGVYSSVEEQIYKYITGTMKLNTAVACGILANIEAESNFNPQAIGDRGAAFGLCQWRDSRLTKLKSRSRSYTSAVAQLEFIKYELSTTEQRAALKIVSNNTDLGAYNAGYNFCKFYERPSNTESESKRRGNIARNKYWKYYSTNPNLGITIPKDIGKDIVSAARGVVNSPYIEGGTIYNNNSKGADSPGLVYYSYTRAGFNMKNLTVQGLYDEYKNTAQKISRTNDRKAADLLFYVDDRNILSYVAIDTGSGSRIYANRTKGIIEDNSIGNPKYILRVLSNAETSQDYTPVNSGTGGSSENNTTIGLNPESYISLTSQDPYKLTIESNLSRVKAEGYDYSYLIDMTNGGEFRFYTPEFTERAGANWGDIDIRGRSVTVKTYNSTSSRSITISLDLYAGVGMYKATSGESGEDTVSRLHKDAYFLKSLEYPDYSNVITRPPAVVNLILGAAVNLTGIVSDVSVEHLKPLDKYNRSLYIKVSFTVTQIATNPVDFRDIRQGQYSLIDTSKIDSLLVYDSTNTPTYTKR